MQHTLWLVLERHPGTPHASRCVRDPAPAPELVQQIWRVGDGHSLHDATNVKCAAIGARCIEVRTTRNYYSLLPTTNYY